MAGPKADVDYNPTQSVAPTSGAPNDYLQVRADPSAFGAQIGEATSKLGATVSQAGQDQAGIEIQKMGLANEHAANQADMQRMVQGGKIDDEFQSLHGLDATTSKDAYVQKYLDMNEQIRSSLNPAAARAYDQIATRQIGFTISNMNKYATTEQNKAYATGNDDAIKVSKDQLGRVDVASDPNQFGFQMGTMVFNLNAKFTAPQYGKYQNITATTNSNGTLKFDTGTDEGRIAQADYDNNLNQIKGDAYKTAVETIANDLSGKGGYDKAYDFMNAHNTDIPAAAKADLLKSLRGPFLNESARSAVETKLSVLRAQYEQEQGSSVPSGPVTPGQEPSPITSDKLTDAFLQQESGNGKTSTNLGQIQPGTWEKYAQPGEDINNPKDNRAVTKRILDDYSKRYSGDTARIAVAYFSGPGNVSPVGSLTPWVNDTQDSNGKKVSSYVPDIQSKTGVVAPGGSVSFATWLGYHESDAGDQLRSEAGDKGLDTTGQDLYSQRWHSRVQELQSYQSSQVKYLRDTVAKVVMDPQHPVTNQTMLDNSSDPKIRDAWQQIQKDDYWSTLSIQNRIKGNAQGASKSYGTNFSDNLLDVLSGKVKDPTTLSDYIGGDKSPISVSGYAAIEKTHEMMQTPEGQAFAHSESQFLDIAKRTITGSGLPGINGAARQPQYEKFVQGILPQVEMMRNEGKTPAEIFSDPKSPVFRSMQANAPDLAAIKKEAGSEAIANMINPPKVTPKNAAGFDLSTLKSRDDLVKNFDKLSPQEFSSAAIKLGLARPDEAAPSVPLPGQ